MNILKYEKLKNNKYKLYLDNKENIILYDDVILNNNLLLTKEIVDIDKLIIDNNLYEAYNKAIKYLGIKLRTEKELKDYLKKYYDKDIIDNTILKIKNNNYLDNELYVKSYINDKINLSNDGYYKIKRDLINKDIDEELITNYLNEIDNNIWLDKIKKIINKKIKCNTKYSNNYLKEKIMHDLNNLGYDKSDIINIINDIYLDDDLDSLKKNYNSIYNKYVNKYNDKELNTIIINKLMSKGFKYNDIKNIINKKEL